jgi:DNA invertase Pin-like site-specific DNA recombinase
MTDQSQCLRELQGKRAGIYCRAQGSSENVKKELSIQFDQAEKFCATRKWVITRRYHDVGSANWPLARRPGLSNVMEDTNTDVFEALVVQDWDRLSRNVTIREQIFTFFMNCGVSVFSLRDGCGEIVHITLQDLSMRPSKRYEA